MNQAIYKKYKKVESEFSKTDLLGFLRQVADTPAPSQSVRLTRGPVIRDILNHANLKDAIFDLDYMGTGNCVLHAKGVEPEILFIAHLDQISYLLDEEVEDGIWRVIPFCKHLSQRKLPAVVLRYDLDQGQYIQAASGSITTSKDANGLTPYFELDDGDLQSGDRIVIKSNLKTEGDLVKGNLDNAAGVAACLLAAQSLFRVAPNSRIGFVFSDEEEGPTESLLYFARGVRRLMHKIKTPRACFIIDGHGGRDGADIGRGTFFTEKTGGGVATITPPEMFLRIKKLANEIGGLGINLFEDEGRVSRSDDIPCLAFTPNVCSVGYPSMSRHRDGGMPTASVVDLVNLAKVIFWLGLEFDLDVRADAE